MKQITIIGGGFAALSAIKHLRAQNKAHEITLISPNDDFLYAPSLIWIPTGLRTPNNLKTPLAPYLRKHRIKHIKAYVTGLKDDGRTVITTQGAIKNDALIIASGARFLKKAPGIENVITICEGTHAAEHIKERLQAMQDKGGRIAFGFAGNPNEAQALRGGPIFELMFGIERWLRQQQTRHKFTLNFFSPSPTPGIRLGQKAYEGLIKQINKHGITLASLGGKIKAFETDKVITEKTSFASDLTIFMPGLTGPEWLQNSPLPLSAGGMILADKHTKVPTLPHVYAIGDCASYADAPQWAPKQAHMADLQGKTAAKNLLAALDERPATNTFRWELICIIDTLDKGILVFRNSKISLVLPACRFFHWSKRAFERLYMSQYKTH